MSKTTKNLGLFEWDTTNPDDLNKQFNIEKSMNENMDKIDTAIGENQTNIETNKNNLETQATKIKNLETDNTKNKNDISTLQTSVKNNDTEVRQEITTIKEEQVTQNEAIKENANDIATNEEEITKLKKENTALIKQIPTGEAEGDVISLTDSASGLAIEDLRIKGKSYKLSDKYQEVEYIESTDDKAYLDFRIPFSNDTRIQYKFYQTTYNGNRTIGTGSTTTNSNEMRFFITGGNMYLDMKTSMARVIYANENLLNVVHEFEIGNCYVKDLRTNEYLAQKEPISEDIFVKTNSNIRTGDNTGVVRSYYVKIYDGDVLVRDCIPCYRKSDGEIGMYDLVKHVFYTNQGASNFGRGEDVVDTKFPNDIRVVTGEIEVGVNGKNLIKFAKEDWIGGYFNDDGTMNNFYNISQSLTDSKYYVIPKDFSEITFSLTPLKDLKVARGQIAFYDKEKNPISSISSFWDIYGINGVRLIKKIWNLQIPDNARYFRVNFRWVVDSSNGNIINMYDEFYNYISDLQLEVGTEATEYVLHEGENYTLDLGNLELLEDEYLYKKNDNWYKHKVYEKIASYNNEEITTDYISTTGILSEGATVYYKLEIETEEEIVDETLIEQLNALNEAKTAKDITNIDSATDGLEPILSFKYKKDLQIENEKINSRLDEVEALLSTTATSALLLDNLEEDLKMEVM